MTDETKTPPVREPSEVLDSDEAVENARRLEEQRRQLIDERWLATHVLAVHLDIESMLALILRQTLPRPNRFLDRPGMGPTFAQKLSVCDSLDLLDDNLVTAIRALNRLRNSYAHTADQDLGVPELVRFLAAMHTIHPFTFPQSRGSAPVEVHSYEELLTHFNTIGRSELDGMLFISLRLLRANLSVLFTDEQPGQEASVGVRTSMDKEQLLFEQWKIASELHRHEDNLTWQKFNYFVAVNGILLSVLVANWKDLSASGNLRLIGMLMSSFGAIISVVWFLSQWRGLLYQAYRIEQAKKAEDDLEKLRGEETLNLYQYGLNDKKLAKPKVWLPAKIPTQYLMMCLAY